MGNKLRLWVQMLYAALTNGYLYGFVTGKIYTGPTKALCLPGLNCYSCPGALGACPIGALQAELVSPHHKIAFYTVGFFLLFGSVFGRFVCGWLCPFGLVQDLLYKIPFPKKRKNLPGHRILIKIKYVILAVFVILLPLTVLDIVGQGSPWFCKYICPEGTLMAALPLLLKNDLLRDAAGGLFFWKLCLLVIILLAAVLIYRPFCKYLCPLGAIYSFFQPIALYRYELQEEKCTHCGRCQKVCKMDIRVWEIPNSPECIRCGDCVKECPEKALKKINVKR